ncbi:hypothetical protein EMIHUDRAFT_465851, partial [Emiliania huxleyi CCMP1516]|uniref:Uncharacterized protein n=2 Tax=Emiliania huxleyi TaxID=2903 RepID=A0A0D3I5L9_EMIH1
MDVLHPVSRPSPDARRHWTVRICQITPLVRKELTDGEASSMLQQLLDKARCRPHTAPRRQGGLEASSSRRRRTARARSRLRCSPLPRRREWERPGRARGGGQRRVRGSGQRRRRWRGGTGRRPKPAA